MGNEFIKRLQKNTNLISILIQIEDFMDNLDLYVFENWIDGEVVDGPNVSRYWVDLSLLFKKNQMPDPQGGLRLTKHGVKVKFKKAYQKVEQPINNPSDNRPDRPGKPKFTQEEVWLVTLQFPRKFIEELDDDDLELYDSILDIEDISDARDENIDANKIYDQEPQDESDEEDI